MSSGDEDGSPTKAPDPTMLLSTRARDKRKGRPIAGSEVPTFKRPIAVDKQSVQEWINDIPPVEGELSAQAMGAAAMADLMEDVWGAIEETRLNWLTQRYSVACAEDMMLRLIDAHNLVHDADEHPSVVPAEALRQWALDIEAEAPPSDQLVRGTIRIRRQNQDSPSRPASKSSSRMDMQRQMSKRPKPVTVNPEDMPPGLGVGKGLGKGSGRASRNPSISSDSAAAKYRMPPDELEAREALQQRVVLKQKKARIEQAERDERAQFDKLAADMKGKDFFVGRTGEVIVIAQPDADRLPQRNVQPRIAMGTSENLDAKKKDKSKRRTPKLDKDKRNTPENFFKLLPPIQPPLFDVLEVQSGVVMKEGNREKRGDDKKETSKMSRKEYLAHASNEFGEVRKPSTIAATDGLGAALSDSHATGGSAAREKGGLGADKPSLDMKKLDEGNMPLVSASNSQVWDTQSTRRSVRTEGSAVSESPSKPDIRAKQAAMGKLTRMPRERPFIEHERPTDRTRLPPPVYPGSEGHGFVKGYLAEGNQLLKGIKKERSAETPISSPQKLAGTGR